jgi:hypothetical protein
VATGELLSTPTSILAAAALDRFMEMVGMGAQHLLFLAHAVVVVEWAVMVVMQVFLVAAQVVVALGLATTGGDAQQQTLLMAAEVELRLLE